MVRVTRRASDGVLALPGRVDGRDDGGILEERDAFALRLHAAAAGFLVVDVPGRVALGHAEVDHDLRVALVQRLERIRLPTGEEDGKEDHGRLLLSVS